MNKAEIYEFLKSNNIWHDITEHAAVYHMSDLSDTALPFPQSDAKNLFVRDDKKRNYYLITVMDDKRVNLKQFRQKTGTRPLSFASEHELMDLMGLFPGAVTPLGILNDTACRIQCFLDESFLNAPGLIGVHPNDNTATVYMKTTDLIHILKKHGNSVHIIQIE